MVYHFDQASVELSLPIPKGRWHKVFDSAEEKWNDKGSQAPLDFESRRDAVHFPLNPWSFCVFTQPAH